MSLPRERRTYLYGGSLGSSCRCWLKIISCCSGNFLFCPELFVLGPNALGINDADLALRRAGGVLAHASRCIDQPRDEDAIDALELTQILAPLRAAPHIVARDLVLPLGKDQRLR